MKLATWNINGIRARHERLLAWLGQQQPDVLCLQEIKTEDAKFPVEPYQALGYQVVTFGQKAYNGVAILSRFPLSAIDRGFADGVEDSQARFLSALLPGGLRVLCAYFPNGESVGAAKYEYKLAWLARLRAYLAARLQPSEPWLLCGDFNVAPTDRDVYDPVAWQGKILCSEAERQALEQVRQVGFIDALRQLHPTEVIYSWWDYRALGFPKNLGMRLDHIWITPALLPQLSEVWVDREARKGPQPSDHAPVLVQLLAQGPVTLPATLAPASL